MAKGANACTIETQRSTQNRTKERTQKQTSERINEVIMNDVIWSSGNEYLTVSLTGGHPIRECEWNSRHASTSGYTVVYAYLRMYTSTTIKEEKTSDMSFAEGKPGSCTFFDTR